MLARYLWEEEPAPGLKPAVQYEVAESYVIWALISKP